MLDGPFNWASNKYLSNIKDVNSCTNKSCNTLFIYKQIMQYLKNPNNSHNTLPNVNKKIINLISNHRKLRNKIMATSLIVREQIKQRLI